MKDLHKNYIYDLSYLNKEERTELFRYLLSVDESYKGSNRQFASPAKDLIYFDNYNQWYWCDWDYAPDSFYKQIKKERSVINAKTLFAPKVNIINPTESDIYNGEPKYKFQHVEVNKIDNSIDLIFFKKNIDGSVSVKRVVYLCHANDEIPYEYLDNVKVSVIKFLEKCEK